MLYCFVLVWDFNSVVIQKFASFHRLNILHSAVCDGLLSTSVHCDMQGAVDEEL